jgi:hypothetical protein
MDIRFEEEPMSRAGRQNTLADPCVFDPLEPKGADSEAGFETGPAKQARFKGAFAVALVPGAVYGTDKFGAAAGVIHQNLFFDVRSMTPLSFDYSEDRDQLVSLAKTSSDQIVVLQEVWQPPIRGLLHYFVQLKTKIFPDRPLWILLTQTPGEENRVVEETDINFKVWKRAILQLGNPDILVERVYK